MIEQQIVFGDVEVPYRYGSGCTDEVVESLAKCVSALEGVLFVVDQQVKHYAEPIIEKLSATVRVESLVLDASERHKTLDEVEAVMEFALARGLSRSTAVIIMGGGVTGNVAGLAASLLFRGTPLIHLPTTPVSAFDSVISMKQGVNLRIGKNLCGTYFAPSLILADLRWLTSVPPSTLRPSLAEMAKNVLITAPEKAGAYTTAMEILDDDPLSALTTMMDIGITAKAPYLRDDPKEKGRAIIFEYGHTAGHAIEFITAGAVSHGEAVAWGMLVAAEVSRERYGLAPACLEEHYRLLGLLDLPDPGRRFSSIDRPSLKAKLTSDNKRGYAPCRADEVPMVLLEDTGRPLGMGSPHPLLPVPLPLVEAAIDRVLDGGPVGNRVR
jgi:3-dehydroquinate synthetase